MNPYYLIGFSLGLLIGLFIVWHILIPVKKEESKEKEEKENNISDSSRL